LLAADPLAADVFMFFGNAAACAARLIGIAFRKI